MNIKAAVYCCIMKSKTCTDDVDQKKDIYDIVLSIVDAIESSKTSKPIVNAQTSGEKIGALLVSMIGRFDIEKKDTVLMLCIE